MDDFKEYITFVVTASDGTEVEMAVVDEFEFEKKNYVAAAKIEGDSINEDGFYIFKIKADSKEFDVEKIADPQEYQKIANAYMDM